MDIFERDLLIETLREELEQRGYQVSREQMWRMRRFLKRLENVESVEQLESVLASEERATTASV